MAAPASLEVQGGDGASGVSHGSAALLPAVSSGRAGAAECRLPDELGSFPGSVERPVSGAVCVVGLMCLDIVNTVEEYPKEDDERRILESKRARGGNASNTASMLSLLKVPTAWVGTCMDPTIDADAKFLLDDLALRCGVKALPSYKPGTRGVPTSYIFLSKATGSRTITHFRGDMGELTLQGFLAALAGSSTATEAEARAAASSFAWFHFEGRNLDDTLQIMAMVQRWRNEGADADGLEPGGGVPTLASALRRPCVSVEAEKVRDRSDETYALADVVLLSKEFAFARGFRTPAEIMSFVASRSRPGTLLASGWGEEGAYAFQVPWRTEESLVTTGDGSTGPSTPRPVSEEDVLAALLHSPAFPPRAGVVDTLGAGDTFNAAMIRGLSAGMSPQDALRSACFVAGAKCGRVGLDLPLDAIPLEACLSSWEA